MDRAQAREHVADRVQSILAKWESNNSR
jgi:hypothetical protein